MMTEYQKQKLNELASWLWNFQDTHRHDMEEAIKLVEEIRDYPILTPQVEETSADSAIMDAYFQINNSLEIFRSIDGAPIVCLRDDSCIGMTLYRFIELLVLRNKQLSVCK